MEARIILIFEAGMGGGLLISVGTMRS
jgi:hypothetical protein